MKKTRSRQKSLNSTSELYRTTSNDASSSDRIVKDAIRQLRRKGALHGSNTREGLKRLFAQLDRVIVDGQLSVEELAASLPQLGVQMRNNVDVLALKSTLDKDGSGFISFEEFFEVLKQPLTKSRGRLLMKAFNSLNPQDDKVEMAVVLDRAALEFHPWLKYNPTVEEFRAACDKISQEMYDVMAEEGKVSKKSWIKYFQQISDETDDDDQFGLIISQMFDVSFIPSYSLKKALKMMKRAVFSKAGSEDETIKRIKHVFKKYDKNNDKVIDYEEFSNLLISLGVNLKEQESRALYEHLDTDSNGVIDVNEFRQSIERASITKHGRSKKSHMPPE